VAERRYKAWGETRYTWGTTPTSFRYTGQWQEESLGLYQMGARFYDPALSRWLSADTLVPGTAASSGGGAATLGYDEQVRLTPLTVGFHETQFLSVVGEENREIAARGFWFQRSEEEKRQSRYQWGPINPQALNRYAYCLGNPLRWTDPQGHWTFGIGLGGTGGAGGGISGSVMIVFDDNGHIGIAISGGGGGYAGVSASGGVIFQRTNADIIQDLQGPVVQTGGSLTLGVISGGGEWVIQQGPESAISGFNVNIGAGPGLCPIEMHGILEGTKIIVLGTLPPVGPVEIPQVEYFGL